jgi:hypothetical protein
MEPSEIESEPFSAALSINPLDHVDHEASHDFRRRVRTIVGNNQNSGAITGRLFQRREAMADDRGFVVGWNDNDSRRSRRHGYRSSPKRPDAGQELDGKAESQKRKRRKNRRDEKRHRANLTV